MAVSPTTVPFDEANPFLGSSSGPQSITNRENNNNNYNILHAVMCQHLLQGMFWNNLQYVLLHSGIEPVQFPERLQTRISSPSSKKPGLQLYVAITPSTMFLNEIVPFLGSSNSPQLIPNIGSIIYNYFVLQMPYAVMCQYLMCIVCMESLHTSTFWSRASPFS